MCGIGGYIVTKDSRVRPSMLHGLAIGLLDELEIRGRDATGYGFVSRKDDYVYVAKAPITASEFLEVEGHLLSKVKISSMPWAILLHTRAATQGSPRNNGNNHPIYSKATGLCLIHNGWVHNDDYLKGMFDLKPDAEVDSEVYLRLIDHYYLGEAKHNVMEAVKLATKKTSGSLACAMVQGGKPGKLWLWRTQGPLEVVQTDFGFVFSSTLNALMAALYHPGAKSVDVTSAKWMNLEPNMLAEISEEGTSKVCSLFPPSLADIPEAYRGTLVDRWDDKQRKWVKKSENKTKVVTYYGNSPAPKSNESAGLPAVIAATKENAELTPKVGGDLESNPHWPHYYGYEG